jgi:hypothetical protein
VASHFENIPNFASVFLQLLAHLHPFTFKGHPQRTGASIELYGHNYIDFAEVRQ